MERIANTVELQKAIRELESRQALELISLREQVKIVHTSLKPIEMVRNSFSEISASPDFKNILMDLSLELTKGFINSKIPFFNASPAIDKVMGYILEKTGLKKAKNAPNTSFKEEL